MLVCFELNGFKFCFLKMTFNGPKRLKLEPAEEAVLVDLDFEGTLPTAQQLYETAIEERDKVFLADQDLDTSTHSGIVTKLFELAIAEFNSSFPEPCSTSLPNPQIEIYVNCLIDLGIHVQVISFLDQALRIIKECRNCKITGIEMAVLVVCQGRALINLSRLTATEYHSDDEDTSYNDISDPQKTQLDESIQAFNDVQLQLNRRLSSSVEIIACF